MREYASRRAGISATVTLLGMMAGLVAVLWSGCGRDTPGKAEPAETPPERLGPVSSIAAATVEPRLSAVAPARWASAGEPIPAVPGLTAPRHTRSVDKKYERRYPTQDNWDIEVFSEAAGTQLKLLGKLISHPQNIDVHHLATLASPGFACTRLLPTPLETVFDDGSVQVRRRSAPGDDEPAYQGLSGLAAALKESAGPFENVPDVRVKFKIVRVDAGPDAVTTEVYYQSAGRPATGAVQQNATWTCRWSMSGLDVLPILEWIGVKEYQSVTGPAGGRPLFTDCTKAVLGANQAFSRQLLPHLDQWRATIHEILGVPFTGHHGISIGDFNGDGLDDLFICQPGGMPNKLFLQNPDGTATDVSAQAGVDFLESTRSALILDLDNDGDQDLVLAFGTDLLFLLNRGRDRLDPVAIVRLPFAHSMTAADYDNDGDLDIYVGCYSDPDLKDSLPLPYHDANTGRANVLLRNDGEGRFTDVTAEVGLDVNNRRFTFSSSWDDYDNDGDLDLYVANDFGRNNLYRNDSGWFTDVAAEAGVEDVSAGMSVSWGDYNNDGRMDLYVGNMFSSAGNRITYQRRFQTGTDETVRSAFRRHARGNTLFENAGDGTFRDVSVEAGVTMGRWAWSSNFIDFNNDGFEDIFIANGFVTNDDTRDL